MAVTLAQLEQLYLAYFGRPADFDGVAFYTTSGSTLEQVETAFANSAESKALYGTTYGSNFVNAIYNNLFGRDADAAGLAYWVAQIANGAFSPAAAALVILQAAKNEDALTIANKLSAATAFTNTMNNATDILAYQGDAAAAAARGWLGGVGPTSDSLTTAVAGIPPLLGNIEVIGGAAGTTFTLTTGIDNFVAPNATLVDTVQGVIDSGTAANNTLSVLDNVSGNGHTVVQLVDVNSVESTKAALVTLSGVSQLKLVNASTANHHLDFDASGWKDVANITLNGADHLDVVVKGLVNSDPALRLTVAGATEGTLCASGVSLGTYTLNGSEENRTHNSVGTVASFAAGGADITVGQDGYACFCLSHSKTCTSADVTVGDISLGHVNVNAGESGCAYLSVSNHANALDHNATVGNLALGDVTLSAATCGDVCVTVCNSACASGTKGDALAGNLSIGNIHMSVGESGNVCMYASNYAYAENGAATVGNTVVGNVQLDGKHSANMSVSQYAHVHTQGDATVGTLTVGNVVMNGASGSGDKSVHLYNSAYSANGSATVGNVVVGNVTVTTADVAEFTVCAEAKSYGKGNTTIGNMSLGTVTVASTATGAACFTAEICARQYGTGNATAGAITIGDVKSAVASRTNYFLAYDYAYAHKGNASAAGITVGNLALNETYAGTDGGVQCASISAYARATTGNATVGNIRIGDVNINAAGITQENATNEVYVYGVARGSGAAKVGNITMGNVTAKTGVGGSISVSACAMASGTSASSTGLVKVGNVAMNGSKSATLELYVQNYIHKQGTAGGISVGNVSMVAGAHADVYVSISQCVHSGTAGSVSVGNVDAEAARVYVGIQNCSQNGSAGNLATGNITLKGTDRDASSTLWNNYVYNYAGNGNAGNLDVGNVSLSDKAGGAGATPFGQHLHLFITNTAPNGNVGTTTVGNISLALASTNATTHTNSADVYVKTNTGKSAGGNITVGNIVIGSGGVSGTDGKVAASSMKGLVSISSADGNVTVGNISVSGGYSDGGYVVDNFATLTSLVTLHHGAGGTTTVGSVDYSGYASAATLDVSGYAGAATISGAKGGGTITDNAGTNAIVLNNTSKTDLIVLQSTQTGVTDSGTAVTAAQAALDSIAGFAATDTITVVGGIQGNGNVVQNTPAQTYAQFLANAENQITTSGNSAYVAVIGGNTYVALNTGGTVGEIVEVMGTATGGGAHTFSYASYSLTFAS